MKDCKWKFSWTRITVSSALKLYSFGISKVPQFDKKELQTLISTALAFNQANYTEKSWALFTEKLQVAQGVEANLLATESKVEIAIKELNPTINALVKQTNEPKCERYSTIKWPRIKSRSVAQVKRIKQRKIQKKMTLYHN